MTLAFKRESNLVEQRSDLVKIEFAN